MSRKPLSGRDTGLLSRLLSSASRQIRNNSGRADCISIEQRQYWVVLATRALSSEDYMLFERCVSAYEK